MSDFAEGGIVGGAGTPTTLQYDEDIICLNCFYLEPYVGWVRGKHECYTGRPHPRRDEMLVYLQQFRRDGE